MAWVGGPCGRLSPCRSRDCSSAVRAILPLPFGARFRPHGARSGPLMNFLFGVTRRSPLFVVSGAGILAFSGGVGFPLPPA